jgi:molybdate transport system substrate-binding protein
LRSVRLLLLISSCGLLLAACGGAPQAAQPTPAPDSPTVSGQITVFAAASLTDAFEEVATAFEAANPGTTIEYNFAGSQQLAAQITEGAPADVFASANATQMRAAIEGGRITAGSEEIFVSNVLVVITPDDNPGNIVTLQDLATPGLQLLLADEAVPVGQYSRDFLTKASEQPEFGADFAEQVLANVVSFEENVRSVLTKIALGEGDAGIVYTTDAALEAASLQQIAIPGNLNTIANYPIAPVADSANLALAEAFIAFIRSAEAQAILGQYGFIPVE